MDCTLTFRKKAAETQHNGLLVAWGLREFLNVEKYKNVIMVFPFLAGFIDRCTKWMEAAPLTKVYVLYSELMLNITEENRCEGWYGNEVVELEYQVEQF